MQAEEDGAGDAGLDDAMGSLDGIRRGWKMASAGVSERRGGRRSPGGGEDVAVTRRGAAVSSAGPGRRQGKAAGQGRAAARQVDEEEPTRDPGTEAVEVNRDASATGGVQKSSRSRTMGFGARKSERRERGSG